MNEYASYFQIDRAGNGPFRNGIMRTPLRRTRGGPEVCEDPVGSPDLQALDEEMGELMAALEASTNTLRSAISWKMEFLNGQMHFR